ncbi:unnamed protein product [Diatraea saccharalis]|uniref:Phosphatidylethanolamine-binding protein n=1 Tax=Diatraea saccharalis TaxID=40085 RepID=A0A9N9R7Y0_9NEOP|nr:unnamed protein product [Diatraea saccharalis]
MTSHRNQNLCETGEHVPAVGNCQSKVNRAASIKLIRRPHRSKDAAAPFNEPTPAHVHSTAANKSGAFLFHIDIFAVKADSMVNRVFSEVTSTVTNSFEANQVVPDVVPKAPTALVKVVFPSGVEVNEGNELTPTQVKDVPTVTWDASPDEFYTLAMTELREFEHWLVVNIPGNDVTAGETLAAYIGSGPSQNSGLHRYVYLVYKQPSRLTFDEPRLPNTSADNRTNFFIAKFAEKYELGDPIAGNFYQAQYDDYVPILFEQLGIDTYN